MQKFDELGLSDNILKAINELGFENPTAVQEKTIPFILASTNDLIAIAQTGTGKTAAFGLPIIEKADIGLKQVQGLILSPTRELAIQITEDLTKFSKHISGFSVIPVYGGASIDTQIRNLKKGAHIVVGTPGRVNDLINRKSLIINKIKWLVLDEADEMLNMGFKDDLDSILETTPEDKQTLLFSATMPKEVYAIANKYMKNMEEIAVGGSNKGAENVSHEYYVAHAKDRYIALKRLADMNPNIYSIVFCRTRRETQEVADKLIKDGYNADALHGDLSQSQRDHVMLRFREKNLQMLVATDVAARGLDVNDLTHVINYNLPDELEAYIHRSGRTGRASKKGISIAIINTREQDKIKQLEKKVGKKFDRKNIPSGKEICEIQLFNIIENIKNIEVIESEIAPFLPKIYENLDLLTKEDLIKRIASVEFNRFLEYYKNSKDINVSEKDRKADRNSDRGRNSDKDNDSKDKPWRERPRGSASYSRFFINKGAKDELNPSRLIGWVNRNLNSDNVGIGKVDILKSFSFFEVEKQFEKDILNQLNNVDYDGEKVVIQLAEEKGSNETRKSDFKKNRDSEHKSGSKDFGRKSEYKGSRDSGKYKSSDKYKSSGDKKDRKTGYSSRSSKR